MHIFLILFKVRACYHTDTAEDPNDTHAEEKDVEEDNNRTNTAKSGSGDESTLEAAGI